MKQLILVFFMCTVLSIGVQAQDTTDTSPTTAQEVERLVDKYSSEVWSKFEALIQAGTPMVKEGFGWVVKVQIAKGIGYILLPLVGLIVFITGYKIYGKSQTSSLYDSDREEVIGTLALFVGGLMFVFGIFSFYHGLLYLIAPEWYAIKEIMDTVLN